MYHKEVEKEPSSWFPPPPFQITSKCLYPDYTLFPTHHLWSWDKIWVECWDSESLVVMHSTNWSAPQIIHIFFQWGRSLFSLLNTVCVSQQYAEASRCRCWENAECSELALCLPALLSSVSSRRDQAQEEGFTPFFTQKQFKMCQGW